MQPSELAGLAIAACALLCLPLVVGNAIRMVRRGGAAPASLSRVDTERLTRLENSVDTIAVEVERISESQRYLTKLLAERSDTASR